MKRIRVSYDYHNILNDCFRRPEYIFPVGDDEVEDIWQEFEHMSHTTHANDKKYVMLHLLAMMCTGAAFLSGDVVRKDERDNIHCITDLEVLE